MFSILTVSASAVSGVIGGLIGGLFTARNQKRERQLRFFREQLGGLYGPLLAMRLQTLSQAELKLKISGAAAAEWARQIAEASPDGVERIREIRGERFPLFQKIIEYNNRQFAQEIMPVYRKMVEHLLGNIHLAEGSTLGCLEELVAFVEIWDRWLAESLPTEVVESLGHSEEKLYPFYDDVASQFAILQGEMKERSRWWRRRRKSREPIKVLPSR